MELFTFEKYTISKDILNSFKIKNELNPIIWENDKLKKSLSKRLLEIADDVYDELDLPFKYDDVILTGSLCNYNYSKYSDFDLHIVIDYEEVNKDEELVKKYLELFKSKWLSKHDIQLYNYDVEIYIQDKDEKHHSTGIYSILNDKWIIKPKKESFLTKDDFKELEKKALIYINTVDDIIDKLDSDNLSDSYDKIKKVWKKIKKGREAGLEDSGEMSIENLVFKLLRRSGYIEKSLDIMNKIYDLQKEKGFN